MIDFIINPLAGGKNGKKIKHALPLIEKRLGSAGIPYAFHYTEYSKHATKITESLIANGATKIVVIGGDGTLHEALNGFSNFDKTTLGVIPCGTGNDFASALHIPEDPLKALEIILKDAPQFTDFMQMPTVRGLNIIGMGLDVDVLRRYEKCKRKTKLSYTFCLIKSLFNFKYSEFDVVADGKPPVHYRSIIAAIANGHRYGGGISICPTADPADKKLDFVAMKEIKGLKLISAFLKLKKGKILTLPQAVHFNMRNINIDAGKHYTVQVDGQLYEDIPFNVEIVSDTLRFFR